MHIVAGTPTNNNYEQGYLESHRQRFVLLLLVLTYLNDVSRRRQREGNTADNKAESWQVVDLAAVHHVLKIKTTQRFTLRATKTPVCIILNKVSDRLTAKVPSVDI